MKGRGVLFSNSKESPDKDEWATPQEIFDQCVWVAKRISERQSGFTVDMAASADNAKCERYFTKERDALKQSWQSEIFWCNPPYSNISGFVKKATAAHLYENAKGVMLLPARTDTRWFHDHIWDANTPLLISNPYEDIEVHFIRGRLKFGDSKNSAPFPSMIVVWK